MQYEKPLTTDDLASSFAHLCKLSLAGAILSRLAGLRRLNNIRPMQGFRVPFQAVPAVLETLPAPGIASQSPMIANAPARGLGNRPPW